MALRTALCVRVSSPAGQAAVGRTVCASEASPAQRVRGNGNYALLLDESEDLSNRLKAHLFPTRAGLVPEGERRRSRHVKQPMHISSS